MSPAEIEARLTRLHAEAEHLATLFDIPHDLRLREREPVDDGCWLTLYWHEANDGDDEDGWYIALMSRENGQEWTLSEVSVEYFSGVLFKFYEGVTHQMAMRQTAGTSGADRRRNLFAVQEALMTRLNPDWGNKTKRRHEQILRTSPFTDQAG